MPRWRGPPVCFACGLALCYWIFTTDLRRVACLVHLLSEDFGYFIWTPKWETESGVPVKMTCPIHFHECRLVFAWGNLQLFCYCLLQEVKEAVSQMQLFGECLYNIISRERIELPPHQSFSLLIYMSFALMGSLPPLEILLLTTNKVRLYMHYYVALKSCLFESQIYWDINWDTV